MRMFLAMMAIAASAAYAGERVVIEPSLELKAVVDDNLNDSVDQPLRDQIRRATPGLALRYESQRLRIFTDYSLDSERYMKHGAMDSDLARQRASFGVDYAASQRLTLSIGSSWIDTNTLADLNTDTALAALRVHGQRLSVTPSLMYRLSPLLTVTASASSSATNVANGSGMRSMSGTLGLVRRASSRDRFTVDYLHSRMEFTGPQPQTVNTDVILAGWSHDFGAHDRWVLQAGPRVTGRSRSIDIAASLTHSYRIAAIGISAARNQATVIGFSGPVDTESVQGHLAWTPNRRFAAFLDPAVIRSRQNGLRATVFRGSLGVRYAITPLVDAALAYNHDLQDGAIDPFRAGTQLKHATLSFGFSTRWKAP